MNNPDENRNRILACAIELFAQNGFAKTSVAEIVAKAGCSKGLLFYHFPSKDALIEEAFQSCHNAIEEAASADMEGLTDVVEKLCRRCYQLTRYAITHPNEAAVNTLYLNNPLYCAKKGRGYRSSLRHFEAVNRLVEEGLSKGELKELPPMWLGELFYSIAAVPYTYMQDNPAIFENDAYWENVYDIIRCAMAK